MAASLGGYARKTNFILTVFAVFTFLLHGASDVAPDRVSVFVTKGDSVTLHTNITVNQRGRVKWYFIDSLIARFSSSCAGVLNCTKDKETFRDGVKLDHQTGDITITNISASDAGVYHLKIFSSSRHVENTFQVAVEDVPDAEMMRKSLKEGESVTLDTLEARNPNDVMTWYFNDTLVAEITGDQAKICEDVGCKERFSDRLDLDHQTGSLIISNTKNTDSGLYQLLIKSNRESYSTTSIKSFTVSVTESGVSVKAGIYVVVVLILAAAAVGLIYSHRGSSRKVKKAPMTGEML